MAECKKKKALACWYTILKKYRICHIHSLPLSFSLSLSPDLLPSLSLPLHLSNPQHTLSMTPSNNHSLQEFYEKTYSQYRWNEQKWLTFIITETQKILWSLKPYHYVCQNFDFEIWRDMCNKQWCCTNKTELTNGVLSGLNSKSSTHQGSKRMREVFNPNVCGW